MMPDSPDMMNSDSPDRPVLASRPAADPSQLQVVDYEKSLVFLDPTSAPAKQAKVAMDSAIAGGSIDQLQVVLSQIGQHVPQESVPLMMHAFRSASKQGNVSMVQLLLEQIKGCQPQHVFEIMKYALDGAAVQSNPGMLDFLLGAVREAFQMAYPQQFLELIQYAINTTAREGNLGSLKFLMDHTAAATIPINYDEVFGQAAAKGQAETLLKEAIKSGSQYENVILMLLQSVRNLPDNHDSSLGSRQSLKNTAKFQVVKSYKQNDPALFARLMAAIKSFFPEEATRVQSGCDGDVAM